MKQQQTRPENRPRYEEKHEFNEALWRFRKKAWALRRYFLNLILIALAIGIHFVLRKENPHPLALEWTVPGVIALLALSLRVAFEWERIPILRFGRHSRTKGPGLFFHIPLIETLLDHVDSRIRVTDFSAEHVLTRDAVPVFVDAVIFWMVWDAGKAKLEVENYELAVSLSAKTALRNAIGKTGLSAILSDRKGLGRNLQEVLDEQTNPWGITSLAVEIKEIIIPEELEKALSSEARAERERQARLLLAGTEKEIARLYEDAGKVYGDEHAGLQLRSLNLLADTLKESGSLLLSPSDIPSMMQKATAAALSKMEATKNHGQGETMNHGGDNA